MNQFGDTVPRYQQGVFSLGSLQKDRCRWRCRLCIGPISPLGAWGVSKDPVVAFQEHYATWHDRLTHRMRQADLQDSGPTMEQQYGSAITTATKLSIFEGTR